VGAAIPSARTIAARPRTPGVATPIATPAVVTPPPAAASPPPVAAAPSGPVTPPPAAALLSDQRIRTFWLSDPARKKAVEDWVRTNVNIRMVDFLRLAAQEPNRQRLISALNIP
jgi:hypothetical protein